jgi:heme/copper-type cytochrome/quinol oxidase subunit 2
MQSAWRLPHWRCATDDPGDERVMKKFLLGLSAAVAVLSASAAVAGQPVDWQLGFQQAATPIMEQIRWFEQYTLWFIVPITLFVSALLAWVILKYRASVNPVPSRTSHNTLIEVVWTVAPVVILLFLAVPSFQLLTAQYDPDEDPTMTVKATGFQWYWEYEYQADTEDEQTVSFSSIMLQEGDRAAEGKEDMALYPRLLAVDNEVVVRYDRAPARHRRRRAARIRHARFRRQGGRRAGPHQRNVVPCHARGPLLRPVFGIVRQGSCLHADRNPRREPGSL